jgi:hypothetical protein
MIMTLLTIAGSAWAWEGSGTATDPYLIKNEMDWTILVSETKAGTTFSDKVFRLTTLTHGKYADEEDKWPGLPVLRYEDGKIVSSGGKHSVVLMPASSTPTPYSDSISRISS